MKNINYLINANATPMTDGSKWIVWHLRQIKRGITQKQIEAIAYLLEESN